MNNVNLPIETIRDGNKITKICVEDVTKMLNRIKHAMNVSYSNMSSHMHSINKRYKGASGPLVVGKGVSQPCFTDAFDEEIGNNIAFMKAKLNANIKKYRLLLKIVKEQAKLYDAIHNELSKLAGYITLDVEGIRKHNPDYHITLFKE